LCNPLPVNLRVGGQVCIVVAHSTGHLAKEGHLGCLHQSKVKERVGWGGLKRS
jgi:hypothetical protein